MHIVSRTWLFLPSGGVNVLLQTRPASALLLCPSSGAASSEGCVFVGRLCRIWRHNRRDMSGTFINSAFGSTTWRAIWFTAYRCSCFRYKLNLDDLNTVSTCPHPKYRLVSVNPYVAVGLAFYWKNNETRIHVFSRLVQASACSLSVVFEERNDRWLHMLQTPPHTNFYFLRCLGRFDRHTHGPEKPSPPRSRAVSPLCSGNTCTWYETL